MDRCAVFVDVGYLYAAGGLACLEVKSRNRIDLDVAGVVGLLAERAASACEQAFLRTYWYDGALRGVPTQEHQRAGLVDDVKVRLGRINSQGQQKGVDALIYRDLMTLARERAITHAYLLAGDGDLVEGVRSAQDMGTHVTLLHIAAGPGQGTSPDLLQEADRRIELTQADLAQFFKAREVTVPVRPADGGRVDAEPSVAPDRAATVAAARAFATVWLTKALDVDVKALVEGYPRIPSHIDADLLNAVEKAQSGVSLRGDEPERKAARGAFWDALSSEVATSRNQPPLAAATPAGNPVGTVVENAGDPATSADGAAPAD